MNGHDPELSALRNLRQRSPAPPVDVVARVMATLDSLPPQPAGLHKQAMAICAAVCALAASIALWVALSVGDYTSGAPASDTAMSSAVIEAFEVDVQSLMR